MAALTYADLKLRLLQLLERENDTRAQGRVAGWIAQAEEDIFARLRAPWMVNVATITLDEDWEELPPGFLGIKGALAKWSGRWYELVSATTAQLPGLLDETWFPTHYCVEGFSLTIVPMQRPVEVRYTFWLAEEPLVADSDTNTTLQRASNIYLYGAARHAAVFYGDDPTRYDVPFQMAIGQANEQAAEWAAGDGFTSALPPRRRRIHVGVAE